MNAREYPTINKPTEAIVDSKSTLENRASERQGGFGAIQ